MIRIVHSTSVTDFEDWKMGKPGQEVDDSANKAKAAPTAEHKMLAEVHPTPPAAKDNAASTKDAPAVKDAPKEAPKIADKASDTNAIFTPARETMQHLGKAKQISEQISTLDKEHKNPNDKISVTRPDGKVVEMTVNERVKELKADIRKELDASSTASQKINGDSLKRLAEANFQEKYPLLQKHGIDMTVLSPEDVRKAIDQKIKEAGNDPTKAQELRHLRDLHDEGDNYRKVYELPSAASMIYAQYMSAGLTNTKYGLEKGENGKLKVDVMDVQIAASLIMKAGENPNFRENTAYKQALGRLGENLGTSDSGERITKTVAEAAMAKTPAEKEALLKKAVEDTDKMGLKVLAALRHDPEFMARQPEDVRKRLEATVDGANDARLAYMRLLTDQGRMTDAEKFMVKIKADDVQAVYNKDGTYKSEEWQRLDMKMAFASSPGMEDFKKLTDLYNQKCQDGQFTSSSTGNKASYEAILASGNNSDIGADRILAAMTGLKNRREQDRLASIGGLDEERKVIEQKLKDLPKKEFDLELKRDLEKAELEDKLRVLDITKKQLEVHAKEANAAEDAMRTLMSVSRHLSLNEKSVAAAELETLQREHPDYWQKQLTEEQRQQLKDSVVETPWYKDWRVYAIAAAGIVGAVVGFGVASGATGPAAAAGTAALLGVSTATATAGLAVVGTGAGIVLGGVAAGGTYWGVHNVADWMGATRPGDQADFSKDFAQGWRIGSKTAAIGATIPAMAAVLGPSVGVAGMSGGARMAMYGKDAARLLPASFTAASVEEFGSRMIGDKKGSMYDAAKDIALNTGYYTAFNIVGGRLVTFKGVDAFKVPLSPLVVSKETAQGMANVGFNYSALQGIGALSGHADAWSKGSEYNADNRFSFLAPSNGYAESLNSRESIRRATQAFNPYALNRVDRTNQSVRGKYDPWKDLGLNPEQ